MGDERGFTLIEVMIALVILTVVLLGQAATTGTLVRRISQDGWQEAAISLAHDRIARIRLDPDYDVLEDNYESTWEDVADHPGFRVLTEIEHKGGTGQNRDFKRITVRVTAAGITDTVSRTISVSAP